MTGGSPSNQRRGECSGKDTNSAPTRATKDAAVPRSAKQWSKLQNVYNQQVATREAVRTNMMKSEATGEKVAIMVPVEHVLPLKRLIQELRLDNAVLLEARCRKAAGDLLSSLEAIINKSGAGQGFRSTNIGTVRDGRGAMPAQRVPLQQFTPSAPPSPPSSTPKLEISQLSRPTAKPPTSSPAPASSSAREGAGLLSPFDNWLSGMKVFSR